MHYSAFSYLKESKILKQNNNKIKFNILFYYYKCYILQVKWIAIHTDVSNYIMYFQKHIDWNESPFVYLRK